MRAAAQRSLGASPTYALRDLFTTTTAAPLPSPRTCDPGPGKLTLVDTATGAVPAISGGKYVQTRPTGGAAWNAEGWVAGPYVRVNGLMAYALFTSATQAGYGPVSWMTTSTLASNAPPVGVTIQNNATELMIASGAIAVTPVGVTPAATAMQLAVIMRGNGYLYLIRGGAAFPNWTLLWVDGVGIDPTVYAGMQGFNSQLSVDTDTVLQKTGPLARDCGKCVLYLPIVTAGTAYVGAADSLDYIDWTPAAGETFSQYFRMSDSSNLYRLDCAQGGSTIKLFRRVAGVDTELASGKTQTWAAGTPVRISAIHVAGDIRTFTQIRGGNIVAKHVVTGESFNLAATGVQASGGAAIANFEVWPRTFSGTDDLSLS